MTDKMTPPDGWRAYGRVIGPTIGIAFLIILFCLNLASHNIEAMLVSVSAIGWALIALAAGMRTFHAKIC